MSKQFAIAFVILAGLLGVPGAHSEPSIELNAWDAAKQMGLGVNIGNTLDNTTTWETGWGNPRITRKYIESLAAMGFKMVPVLWETGGDISRKPPYAPSAALNEVLQKLPVAR